MISTLTPVAPWAAVQSRMLLKSWLKRSSDLWRTTLFRSGRSTRSIARVKADASTRSRDTFEIEHAIYSAIVAVSKW